MGLDKPGLTPFDVRIARIIKRHFPRDTQNEGQTLAETHGKLCGGGKACPLAPCALGVQCKERKKARDVCRSPLTCDDVEVVDLSEAEDDVVIGEVTVFALPASVWRSPTEEAQKCGITPGRHDASGRCDHDGDGEKNIKKEGKR